MNNALYLQSGGPTSVINASFYGVIKETINSKKIDKLYGSLYGVDGLINDELVLIDKPLSYYEEIKDLNGAILGTTRHRLDDEDLFSKISEVIIDKEIKYLFINGGNDSMDTANKLNNYFCKNSIECIVVGIPKTIDNDLDLIDHSPGFGSNVKYIVRTLMEIYLDINSYKEGRATIVEIMGRDTGWLTASSICATLFNMGPDLIYVPESPFDKDKFINDVKEVYKRKKKVFICVSEALKDKSGNYISAEKNNDGFEHQQLGSVSKKLSDLIKRETGLKARNIELSLSQRSACHLSSKIDKKEAIALGRYAVKYALDGKRGMVGLIRKSNSPYKVQYKLFPLDKVANTVKYLPNEYINKEKNNINKSYIDYCMPFIDLDEIKISSAHLFLKNK